MVLEQQAAQWRLELGITSDQCVLLFAGKFEPKKRPIELMRAVQTSPNRRLMLVMVGGGELGQEVKSIANSDPDRFRLLPFQNQSRMPVVYRLGDLFVLPSAFGETWGLAVNEALACGRPVLVSDRVGCAPDIVNEAVGKVFSWSDASSLTRAITTITRDRYKLLQMGRAAAKSASSFDVARTEVCFMDALNAVCGERRA
jgi:glycosyltransferase involved in cell wall biosynthesis